MLNALRALQEFASTGSIAGAAGRLYRTPSAVTRQVQRLEAALGAELLDRSVKPPRLNLLGVKVLEEGRELLRRAERLRSLASSEADPRGLLRVGLSHALADETIVAPLRALTESYPGVRLRLLSKLTDELFSALLAGELDLALVLLPAGRTAPSPLIGTTLASDRMRIVQAVGARIRPDWESLGSAPWVLNPPGCLLRASLLDQIDRSGFSPTIAAEIHNMHLQLAFVQSGYGLGLLPARFVARHCPAGKLRIVKPPDFDLRMSIVFVRAGPLGALEKAAAALEQRVRDLFDTARRKRLQPT